MRYRSIVLAVLLSVVFALPTQAQLPGSAGPDNLTSNNDAVTLANIGSYGTVGVTATGTFSATLNFEKTFNGSTWFSMSCVSETSTAMSNLVITATTADSWTCYSSGARSVRVRSSPYTSGTAVITINAGLGPVRLLETTNGEVARNDATWGTSTTVCSDANINSCTGDSTLSLDASRAGSGIIWMQPNVTGDVTGGRITFDMSANNGTSWVELSGSNGDRTQTSVLLSGATPYDGGEAGWRFPLQAATRVRARLETAITCAGGAGTCTLKVSVIASSTPTNPFGVARQDEYLRLHTAAHSFPTSTTGSITSNQTIYFDATGLTGSPAVVIAGTWSGTIAFFKAVAADCTTGTYSAALAYPVYGTFDGQLTASTTTNGSWLLSGVQGFNCIAVLGSTVSSGTANVLISHNGSVAGHVMANVGGDKTHDAPDGSSMPVKTGARAVTTVPTAAAADDRVNNIADVYGAQFVRYDHPNKFQCSVDAIGTTLTQCQAAPGAGLSLYITDIIAGSTTSTAGTFLLRYGTGSNCATGTTTLFPGTGTTPRVTSPANTVTPLNITFGMPYKVPAANAVCVLGVATNTTWMVITGFIAP